MQHVVSQEVRCVGWWDEDGLHEDVAREIGEGGILLDFCLSRLLILERRNK